MTVGWVRRRAPPPSRAGCPAEPGTGRAPRIGLFLFVLFGATLIPLSLEVAWRSDGNAAAHVQPEVAVVEQAAQRAGPRPRPVPRVGEGRQGRSRS